MVLYDKLNKILEDEMSVQKQLLKEYSKLPKGNLLIKNKSGYTCFYLDFDGIEKGIKKNKNLLNKSSVAEASICNQHVTVI